MNRLPKFGGDDGQWVYDRIMQVPCVNVIPPEKQDKHLLDKLLSEREGIVYRLVTALKGVIANGYRFTEPESVREDRRRYQETNSTVITFFKDCMIPVPQGREVQILYGHEGVCGLSGLVQGQQSRLCQECPRV